MKSSYRDFSKNIIDNLKDEGNVIPKRDKIDVIDEFNSILQESQKPKVNIPLLDISAKPKPKAKSFAPEELVKSKDLSSGFKEESVGDISYDSIKKTIEFSRLTPYQRAQLMLKQQEEEKKIQEANLLQNQVQQPQVIEVPAVNRPPAVVPNAPPINLMPVSIVPPVVVNSVNIPPVVVPPPLTTSSSTTIVPPAPPIVPNIPAPPPLTTIPTAPVRQTMNEVPFYNQAPKKDDEFLKQIRAGKPLKKTGTDVGSASSSSTTSSSSAPRPSVPVAENDFMSLLRKSIGDFRGRMGYKEEDNKDNDEFKEGSGLKSFKLDSYVLKKSLVNSGRQFYSKPFMDKVVNDLIGYLGMRPQMFVDKYFDFEGTGKNNKTLNQLSKFDKIKMLANFFTKQLNKKNFKIFNYVGMNPEEFINDFNVKIDPDYVDSDEEEKEESKQDKLYSIYREMNEKYYPKTINSRWDFINSKFQYNIPKFNNNILSISKVSQNGRRQGLADFQSRKISDEFKSVFDKFVKEKVIDDLSDLDKEERDYFYEIIALSLDKDETLNVSQKHLDKIKYFRDQINMRRQYAQKKPELQKLNERLAVLIGQVNAGNRNNKQILLEGTQILNRLVRHGIINYQEADTLQKKLV